MQSPENYTKYERVRLISARALQLSQGSPPLVKLSKETVDPIEVAKMEFDAGLIPIDIKRAGSEEKKED